MGFALWLMRHPWRLFGLSHPVGIISGFLLPIEMVFARASNQFSIVKPLRFVKKDPSIHRYSFTYAKFEVTRLLWSPVKKLLCWPWTENKLANLGPRQGYRRRICNKRERTIEKRSLTPKTNTHPRVLVQLDKWVFGQAIPHDNLFAAAAKIHNAFTWKSCIS